MGLPQLADGHHGVAKSAVPKPFIIHICTFAQFRYRKSLSCSPTDPSCLFRCLCDLQNITLTRSHLPLYMTFTIPMRALLLLALPAFALAQDRTTEAGEAKISGEQTFNRKLLCFPNFVIFRSDGRMCCVRLRPDKPE